MGALARRYARLPHEILELDPYQLGIAIETYLAEMNHQRQAAKQKGAMIFPVVIVGSM